MRPLLTRSVAPRTAPHRYYAPIVRPRPADRTLYPGEPETCRRDLLRFLAIWAHLILLLVTLRVYHIEGRAFLLLVGLATAALPVHYALHYRWKRLFFVGISIAGLIWVFGASVAAVVLPMAVVLIGICYLPLSWPARALIMGSVTVVLGVLRSTGAIPLPDCVWPVLAMMFMFRMIVYLYELKHATRQERLLDTLSYFFLLPNYCFHHFPVVDYRTFQRGYFASGIHAIQRTGLQMMFRGMTHLLLYRLVYDRLLIKPEDVHGFASLAGFLVCNYLLYLRVSGQFHMACGMLHLFGFQLPPTHRRYLLATGFTDYWRRINIYWKDFMVRVVFNPIVFRLKRWPQPLALAVATAVVFATTWCLHGYQTFWVLGSWGFSLPDALFWGILGVLVLINVQIDARSSHRRACSVSTCTTSGLVVRCLKTAATFTTIALLWSLWSSPTVGAWLKMLRQGFADWN